MHLVGRAGLRGLLRLMVVASTSCVPANAALAFDFFGLFGSDNTPKPSSTTLPYKVEFEVKGDDDVKRALQDPPISISSWRRRRRMASPWFCGQS